MLVSLKNWCYIFLSLTMVVTLFHVNSMLIDFNRQSHEIVVPAVREQSSRLCLNLTLEDMMEEEGELTDDELESDIEQQNK
jgi:hypothetical protein